MLKLIYMLLLGVLIALFVGWGVEVFYASPKYPEYPTELNYTKGDLTPAQTEVQKSYDEKVKAYQEDSKPYNRNVSIIVIVASLILFALSLILVKKIPFISDSLLLGAAFTLIYGVGRGIASQNSKVQFAAVTVGLIVAFVVGLVKFVSPEKAK